MNLSRPKHVVTQLFLRATVDVYRGMRPADCFSSSTRIMRDVYKIPGLAHKLIGGVLAKIVLDLSA